MAHISLVPSSAEEVFILHHLFDTDEALSTISRNTTTRVVLNLYKWREEEEPHVREGPKTDAVDKMLFDSQRMCCRWLCQLRGLSF